MSMLECACAVLLIGMAIDIAVVLCVRCARKAGK